MAEIQFVPALLALNVIVLIVLIALTLVFGRIYCSTICPMGVYQDIVAFFARRIKSKKARRYTYSVAKTVLRLIILTVFIVGVVAGIGIISALLDPYGASGRIVTELLSPVYGAVNNLFVKIFGTQSYTFTPTEIWIKSLFSFILAVLTLLIIGYLAWRSGRTYCNTFCPVGTILGYLSKFSLLKIRIDPNTCTTCGRCTQDCKASCIDFKNHTVDYTRCVACYNCIESCKDNSITYSLKRTPRKQPVGIVGVAPDNNSRRQFFITSLLMAATFTELKSQEVKRSMIKFPAVRKDRYKRSVPVSPPGSISHDNLNNKCTACLLCVNQCPDKIIRPSVNEYGWTAVMQPTLSFERGYCRTDCTVCSDVCPTNAITKLTKENKTKVAMGNAVYVRENCVVVKDDVNCDACWRICPTDAISREYRDGGTPYIPPTDKPDANTVNLRLVPVVDKNKCIGCGACEYICPARPLTAIFVEGYEKHLAVNN
ncbi:MAG: 4Fe-4S binding protein [Petrimonas sp.]